MSGATGMGLKIAIIDRAFRKRMNDRINDMGLTPVQFRVLGEIGLLEASGMEEINQKDLEKVEQVTHPTMTGIIRRLESKGFVKCIPSSIDRRYKKITCTKKSEGIIDKIAANDEKVFFELCEGLLPEQIDNFILAADLILKNI